MKYLKIFGREWLEGSIRVDLDSAGRGVWADLLAMAQISRRVGYIERSEGIPYTDEELAQRFKIPMDLLLAVVARCLGEGRLGQLKDGTYYITNWNTYQDLELGSSPSDANAIQKAKAKVIDRKAKKPGKRIPKRCEVCDYEACTSEEYCPECDKKGISTELGRDYTKGKYGHVVKR